MAAVIPMEGLSKSFGAVRALVGFDLEVAPLCPTAGRAEIVGLDVESEAVAARRRAGYVLGGVNLWHSLTREEILLIETWSVSGMSSDVTNWDI